MANVCEIELSYDAAKCDAQCAELDSLRVEALAAARQCNPELGSWECIGDLTVLDACGCKVPANQSHGDEIQNAKLAYDAWAGALCASDVVCEPCPATGFATCHEVSAMCSWAN